MTATQQQGSVVRRDAATGDLVPQGGAMTQVASTRAAQEVQAAMVVAKNFPRDEDFALQRIEKACQRRALAEVSQYRYNKGGTDVNGPSIRLAEVLAQNWGNIDFGVVELESGGGRSTMMAYAWDLETNTRSTKVFDVPHQMKAKKQIKTLTDPRDIYEHTANQAARRMRACILAVIPGDIVDAAIAGCNRTLLANPDSLKEQIQKMLGAFYGLGVSEEMIQKRLGHKVTACTAQQITNLRGIYQSIKDEMSVVADWFEGAEGSTPPEPSGNGATGADFAKPKGGAQEHPHPERQAGQQQTPTEPAWFEGLLTTIRGADATTLSQLYNKHVGMDSTLSQALIDKVSAACAQRRAVLEQEAAANTNQSEPAEPTQTNQPASGGRNYEAELNDIMENEQDRDERVKRMKVIVAAMEADDQVSADRVRLAQKQVELAPWK